MNVKIHIIKRIIKTKSYLKKKKNYMLTHNLHPTGCQINVSTMSYILIKFPPHGEIEMKYAIWCIGHICETCATATFIFYHLPYFDGTMKYATFTSPG